jgi:hypothetical protein
MNYFHVSKNNIEDGSILEPRYGMVVQSPRFFRANDHNHDLYMKEMIFEEIRTKKYSFRPSRLSSIYLFAELESARLYPQKINAEYVMNTFQVQFLSSGSIAEFDMTWLDLAGRESYEKIKDIANRYWSGEHTENKYIEVLFAGKVKTFKKIY